jgi:hypothetical protein
MPAFLARSHLSRNDLRLFLSNLEGYAQDAASVRYSLLAADGTPVSGTRLPAIRRRTGEYYIPWIADVPNGSYKVVWEIREDWSSTPVEKTGFFFVVDPSAYPCGSVPQASVPAPGHFTFLTGQSLGPGDLPLFLRASSGLLQDAYAVFFTILGPGGSCVSPRTSAVRSAVGTYWAPWYVQVGSGDYSVRWEYQELQDGPLETATAPFSVVCPPAPFALVEPILWTSSMCGDPLSAACYAPPVVFARAVVPCGYSSSSCYSAPYCPPPACALAYSAPCPPAPSSSCCDYEIPRTVHISLGYLPPSGSFTDQPYYVIPKGIRKVAFYVTYIRGAAGGYAVLRLMWGDGTTEAQETLVDTSISDTSPDPYAPQNLFLQEMNSPAPTNGSPVSFIIESGVPGGSQTVRLIAAEKGVPGAPGMLGITLTASTD